MALNTGRSGNVDGALNLIARLDRDYPEAEDVRSEAMLTQGKFLADSGRWGKAQEVFRALPFQHPMTEAALQTPLEVAKHYALAGDSASHVKALREAESIYLEFITRYPGGQLTTSAREKLASVLASQSRYSEAITELTRLGESLSRTPGGAAFFLRAAQMAWRDLGDTARAAEILKRTGEIYAGTEVGRQTKEMAAELRRSEGSLVRP
jgi:TolA-binding protein